jgi:hypothetical protein
MKIGTRVKFRVSTVRPQLVGTVVGATFIQTGHFAPVELHPVVLVELDKGYDTDGMFVSIVPVSTDIIEVVE